LKDPDLPPAVRFPQARVAERGGDRALVMMAAGTSNRRRHGDEAGPNGNTRPDFAVDGLQFP
jgi:hypothetical protein